MEAVSRFHIASYSFDESALPASSMLNFYPVDECKGSIKDIVDIEDDFALCEDDPWLTAIGHDNDALLGSTLELAHFSSPVQISINVDAVDDLHQRIIITSDQDPSSTAIGHAYDALGSASEITHFSSPVQGRINICKAPPFVPQHESLQMESMWRKSSELSALYGDGRHLQLNQEFSVQWASKKFETRCQYQPHVGHTYINSIPLDYMAKIHHGIMTLQEQFPFDQQVVQPNPEQVYPHGMFQNPQLPCSSFQDDDTVTLPEQTTLIQKVHDHDVLSGRGLYTRHPGNARFRAMVIARVGNECIDNYSTNEKRALAMQIIAQIKSLNPPGRFLKRRRCCSSTSTSSKKNNNKNGYDSFEGSWEEQSLQEVLVKTRQALRDCYRADRVRYASPPPVAGGGTCIPLQVDVRENLPVVVPRNRNARAVDQEEEDEQAADDEATRNNSSSGKTTTVLDTSRVDT